MAWFRYGALMMFLGVVLGAFGAHALKDTLSEEGKQLWQTAVLYHLIHGLAMIMTGWLGDMKPRDPVIDRAGWSFLLGIVLFSGSLYLLSLTENRKLGMITPIGGLAFLFGWLSLVVAAKI
jgi:uncharacterized membrane protein YgdD (TMEM256/DUF423 family)